VTKTNSAVGYLVEVEVLPVRLPVIPIENNTYITKLLATCYDHREVSSKWKKFT